MAARCRPANTAGRQRLDPGRIDLWRQIFWRAFLPFAAFQRTGEMGLLPSSNKCLACDRFPKAHGRGRSKMFRSRYVQRCSSRAPRHRRSERSTGNQISPAYLKTMRWIVAILFLLPASVAANDWDALTEPGAFAIMRHALAPGTGDPADFRLDDCTTQRNLDARGREQARAIGAAFRDRGITFDVVLTSQWCRTRETAELLGLGEVVEAPALNSFFQRLRAARSADARHVGPSLPDRGAPDAGVAPGEHIGADRAGHALRRSAGDPDDATAPSRCLAVSSWIPDRFRNLAIRLVQPGRERAPRPDGTRCT